MLRFKSNQFDLKHEILIRRLLNIEIWYIKIHGPRPPQPPIITGNFKSRKNIYAKAKNKSNSCSYCRKYLILSLPEKSLMFLQTINYVEISNLAFNLTMDYIGDM